MELDFKAGPTARNFEICLDGIRTLVGRRGPGGCRRQGATRRQSRRREFLPRQLEPEGDFCMRHLALALLIALAAGAASVAAAPGDPFAGDDSGCIPPTPTDAKCEDGVAKAITKYAQAVEKCHIKAADAGAKGGSVADDLCESDPSGGKGAKEKFDAAIAKLAGTCSGQCAFVGASSLRATVEGLIETGNALIYACAGTAFGDDDTGNIPADPATGKCEDGVAKAISKYIGALITCHIKAADAGLKGK